MIEWTQLNSQFSTLIKVFADIGTWEELEKYSNYKSISGFTTNPSLLKKGGVINYKEFAIKAAKAVAPKPISFEVFADAQGELFEQARIVSKWGKNIYVKIPVVMPNGDLNIAPMMWCSTEHININITGILSEHQIIDITPVLSLGGNDKIVSIFAGRIADTGKNPADIIRLAKLKLLRPDIKILWASTREVYNIIEASSLCCDIITITPDIIAKLHLLGKDLTQYSKETIQQFHKDAEEAGFTI